jgi:hypothetical protein
MYNYWQNIGSGTQQVSVSFPVGWTRIGENPTDVAPRCSARQRNFVSLRLPSHSLTHSPSPVTFTNKKLFSVVELKTRNAYRILVGKPEGKRPLGRPRRRWVDNIRMDLREIGWDGIGLDRFGSG